jgi:ribose 1,5-bisphosphokinase
MGPSGAGKDSLLEWLMAQLPARAPVHLARRTITRPTRADGEQHEGVDLPTFQRLHRAGEFCFAWRANGLHYGIRRSELAPLQEGGWVIVNGSRAHLAEAASSHPALTVLHITASVETLRQRLLARGREGREAVAARLQRVVEFRIPPQHRAIEIRNDGTLDEAGAALVAALRELDQGPEPGWLPRL